MSHTVYLLQPGQALREACASALAELEQPWKELTRPEELVGTGRQPLLLFLPLASFSMGELNGLRMHNPLADVVVVGKEGTVEEALDAMRHGAADFLRPPLIEQDVVQAVRRWQERRALAEEAERLSDIITLMELGRTLTSNLHLEQLYPQILDLVERAFLPDTVSLMQLNRGGDTLRIVEQRGLPASAAPGTEVDLERSIAGRVVKEGAPQLLLGGLEGTNFAETARRENRIASAMSVPLQVQAETIGVLNVNRYAGRPAYTQEDANLLHIFAAQIAIALKNAQLYDNLRDERDRIIKAQEDVRHALARDMHDGLTQVLARLALDLDFLRTRLESGQMQGGETSEELSRLRVVTRQAIHDARTMMFGLRPLILETRGLAAALDQYLRAMREGDPQTHYHLLLDEKLMPCELPTSVAGMVFAILQEAINNARKHARGENIWVRVGCGMAGARRELVASVRDDGTGFNLAQVEGNYDEGYSFGLLNMKERAELIDARLHFESGQGGTTLHLRVPWREREIG